MSARPPIQLGLLPGFDTPALVVAAASPAPVAEGPPRRMVSAEREMLAAQVSMIGLAIEPPEIEGWREELGRPRPRIVNGTCSVLEERRRPDGSIGPCGYAACPRNLLIDRGEPVVILGKVRHELLLNRAGEHPVMGRRPALAAVPTDGERDAFDLDAIARLDELPDSCEKDVIRNHGGAVPIEVIADRLGVSEEQVRLDFLSACSKLGLNTDNGEPLPGTPAVVEQILATLDRRPRKVRRTWRGKVGKSSRAPAGPRIERDAPAPREPSADEIFTF